MFAYAAAAAAIAAMQAIENNTRPGGMVYTERPARTLAYVTEMPPRRCEYCRGQYSYVESRCPNCGAPA